MSINILLIISIGIVSYISFNNQKLFNKLLFSPYVVIREKEWFRFLTAGWVHGGFLHLAINLFVLFGFGLVLENYIVSWYGEIGRVYYLLLFLVSVIVAHIPTYLKEKDNYAYASVGASGGVSGVLFATILLEPLQNLYLFGIIPIPGIVFGVLYLIYTQRMAGQNRDNINHDAHFFGAIAGIVGLVLINPSVVSIFIDQISSVFN